MGRSQVERNQSRRRRPGTHGRGGRGNTQTSNVTKEHRLPHSLGNNAFRYQINKGEGQAIDYDWDIASAFHFSPVINSVEIESFAQISLHDNVFSMKGEEEERGNSYEINLARISACIDSAHNSEWMRLSDGMTKVFDKRFANTMETERMTITEMARSCQSEADNNSEEVGIPADNDKDSDSDDNLEEWLDSVID